MAFTTAPGSLLSGSTVFLLGESGDLGLSRADGLTGRPGATRLLVPDAPATLAKIGDS